MDKAYLLKNYHVTDEQFERYVEYKIFDPDEDLTDEVLQKIGLAMDMEGFGLDMALVSRYLLLYQEKEKNGKELIKILKNQRGYMLEELHEKQKKLDRIDFMIYELKKTG